MLNAKKVQNCTSALKNFIDNPQYSKLGEDFTPTVALILGTGLGAVADSMENAVHIPWSSLPEYPKSTVPSHSGRFVCGFLGKTPVIIQQGRCHLYEGYTPEEVVFGVRIMALTGAKTLVVTNASGALNPLFSAGELMAISDHINFTGQSPLTGVHDEEFGPRFPDMSQVYDKELLAIIEQEALKLGIILRKGVYIGINGPQLETPAETRLFRSLGADAIGMSTVMEVIAARHMGLKVGGIACLTNKNLPDCMQESSIEEIIQMSNLSAKSLSNLLIQTLNIYF